MATIHGTDNNDNGTWQLVGFPYSFIQVFPALHGTASADWIYGYAGHDILYGYGGNDYLYGDTGDDILDGGTGTDTMYGGFGNDTYYVDNMNDIVIEYANQGFDTVYSSVDTLVKWLPNHVEKLVLLGTARYGDGNDLDNTITGNNSVNSLYGYGGNDILHGLGGDDFLYGDDGHDRLYGGAGKDTLTGGGGADYFIYHSGYDSPAGSENRDVIMDFSWQQGDKIVLAGIHTDHSKMSFNGGILTVRIDNGPDLEIQLTGIYNSFIPTLDVIIEPFLF